MSDSAFRDNRARQRFELAVDGALAFADYRRQDGRLYIDHVETPPALRGGGVAARVMQGIAEAARREGEKVVPICSYAVAWFQRHADQRDLLA
ncbi:MAG TPA: GNAT family N-acetyltransferase [Caulobacteraceae bacterium]|nr:GNAT family N-acetyltransferase [Caulobacteraceae bacterium]